MSRSSFTFVVAFAAFTSSLVACAPSSDGDGGEDPTAGSENAFTGNTPPNAKTCFFDANQPKPNPLGMRTLVTLEKSEDGTIVRYETLPAPVFDLRGSLEGTNATYAVRRDLLLHGSSLDAARKTLRTREGGKLWAEIFDEATAPITFAEWEKTITCTGETFEPMIGQLDTEMCSYDPTTERPNVLGMRTYVSIHAAGANTEARYESLPANVGEARHNATIETIRAVTIEGVRMRDAMGKLRTEDGQPIIEALTGGLMSVADVGEMFDSFTCP